MKLNNKGVTIIELLVSVALLSVVTYVFIQLTFLVLLLKKIMIL